MFDANMQRMDYETLGLICLAVLLPTVLFIALDAPSFSYGLLCVAVLVVVVGLFGSGGVFAECHKNVLKFSLSVVAVPAVHVVWPLLIGMSIEWGRWLGSLSLLFAMVFGGAMLSFSLGALRQVAAQRVLDIVLLMLLVIGSLGVMGVGPLVNGNFIKPIFVYSEPSHYVLVFGPFFIWGLATGSANFVKGGLLFWSILFLFLVKSAVLLVLILLALACTFRVRWIALLVCLLMLITLFDYQYFMDRLPMLLQEAPGYKQLSSLVWLQGWEEAYLSLTNTGAGGVGFQQLGVTGPRGEYAELVRKIIESQNYLNLRDGATLGAKVVAEIGVVGVAVLIAYIVIFFRSFLFIREAALAELSRRRLGMDMSASLLFFHACIVTFSVSMFCRGTGYFSPDVLFFIAGVFGVYFAEGRPRTVVVHC